jgi:hypothetical protein
MDTVGVVVLGIVLRFGVPVLGTMAVIYFLRRLDARWQAEAVEEAQAAELFPKLRCWVLNDCPEERRAKCPAYAQQGIPCWQVYRDGNGRLRNECLGCDVFKSAPVPIPA